MSKTNRIWSNATHLMKVAIILSIIPTIYIFFLISGALLADHINSSLFTGWEGLDLFFALPAYIVFVVFLMLGLIKHKIGQIFACLSIFIGLFASAYILVYFRWGDLWRTFI